MPCAKILVLLRHVNHIATIISIKIIDICPFSLHGAALLKIHHTLHAQQKTRLIRLADKYNRTCTIATKVPHFLPQKLVETKKMLTLREHYYAFILIRQVAGNTTPNDNVVH